jgi:hypothetical protein
MRIPSGSGQDSRSGLTEGLLYHNFAEPSGFTSISYNCSRFSGDTDAQVRYPTWHSRLCSVPAAQSLPSGQNSI